MDDLKPLWVLLKPSSVNLICVTAIICGFHLLMSLWSPRRQINYFNEENILDELKRWDEDNHHQENDKQLSVINSHHCSSRLLSSRNHNYGRHNCSLSPKTAARLEPPSCHPNQSNSTVLNLLGFISVTGNRREARNLHSWVEIYCRLFSD